MPSVAFVMPVHGRLPLTRICLRQLRRTCEALAENGIQASAVIIGDDTNLDAAQDLGFATVRRNNRFLSRKFNDGIQAALDPNRNPQPADYAIPIGSDDWVDWRLVTDLPPADTIVGFQHISFVREDGLEMTARHLAYRGGCGIRIYPSQVCASLGYRPADEDRKRACDTSILTNLTQTMGDDLKVVHARCDPRQIVDWKTPAEQLNPYATLARHRKESAAADPFVELQGIFPEEALAEMSEHYASRVMVAA